MPSGEDELSFHAISTCLLHIADYERKTTIEKLRPALRAVAHLIKSIGSKHEEEKTLRMGMEAPPITTDEVTDIVADRIEILRSQLKTDIGEMI